MLHRRGPEEVDWQAELAARSALMGTQLERAETTRRHRAPGSAIAARVSGSWWKPVRGLVAAAGLGQLVFGGRHHPVGVAFIVLWVLLWPVDAAAARRRRREREKAEEPTPEERVRWEIRSAAHQLRWFLESPPDRASYERWLNSARTQLELVSPDVAARWAQPDRGRNAAAGAVSATELEARRGRLLDLYAEVAAPDQLEFLTSTLRQAPSARAITSS